jgi:hypothetical protein
LGDEGFQRVVLPFALRWRRGLDVDESRQESTTRKSTPNSGDQSTAAPRHLALGVVDGRALPRP